MHGEIGVESYCVRCYTHKNKEKVKAQMVFKGASVCLDCVDKIMEMLEEKSPIIQPNRKGA